MILSLNLERTNYQQTIDYSGNFNYIEMERTSPIILVETNAVHSAASVRADG